MKQRKQKTRSLKEGKLFRTQITLQGLPFQGSGNSSLSFLGQASGMFEMINCEKGEEELSTVRV